MKTRTTAATVLALAAGLAACHPAKLGEGRPRDDRPMAVTARLDCPARQGSLVRAEAAADGRSCRYTGEDGEEVTLGYLATDGAQPLAALAPTEAQVRGWVPAAVVGSPQNAQAQAAAKARQASEDKDDDDRDDDAASNTTGKAGGGDRDRVAINLPGVHVDAGDGGARVHAFGQDVVASDDGAQVTSGWNGVTSQIHANDGGVEIRSGWIGAHALEQGYFLASDAAGPQGVHAAGYVARGPVGGPLVLAVVKATGGGGDLDDDRFRDVKRLVRRNTHAQ